MKNRAGERGSGRAQSWKIPGGGGEERTLTVQGLCTARVGSWTPASSPGKSGLHVCTCCLLPESPAPNTSPPWPPDTAEPPLPVWAAGSRQACGGRAHGGEVRMECGRPRQELRCPSPHRQAPGPALKAQGGPWHRAASSEGQGPRGNALSASVFLRIPHGHSSGVSQALDCPSHCGCSHWTSSRGCPWHSPSRLCAGPPL